MSQQVFRQFIAEMVVSVDMLPFNFNVQCVKTEINTFQWRWKIGYKRWSRWRVTHGINQTVEAMNKSSGRMLDLETINKLQHLICTLEMSQNVLNS